MKKTIRLELYLGVRSMLLDTSTIRFIVDDAHASIHEVQNVGDENERNFARGISVVEVDDVVTTW